MQHGLTTRLSLLAASLVLAASAWATDLKPWSEGDDYLRLENASASNQHPVNFNAEQLSNLLGHFYKKEQGKDPAPYFSRDEIERLAPRLVPVFARASSADDIQFGSSYRPGNFLLVPRVLNAGRLFVENGQLNLIIGSCVEQQDIGYQQNFGKYKPLNHGSRIKPVSNLGCALVAGNDAVNVDNRPDWLRLNISAALANAVVTPSGVKTSLTFAPASAAAPAATPAASAAPVAPVSLPAPRASTAPAAAPAAASSSAVLPAQPASKAEERLQLLKRLHASGLITDAEYEQKRAGILKDL
ncbi:SHOCT domain-containing protein [Chitinimonas sp.]|uniref:SHOCT domain-containing protein n=1 Tax=Chitinimonas sp. TaxID=1934313 RepID=UPI0035B1DA9D